MQQLLVFFRNDCQFFLQLPHRFVLHLQKAVLFRATLPTFELGNALLQNLVLLFEMDQLQMQGIVFLDGPLEFLSDSSDLNKRRLYLSRVVLACCWRFEFGRSCERLGSGHHFNQPVQKLYTLIWEDCGQMERIQPFLDEQEFSFRVEVHRNQIITIYVRCFDGSGATHELPKGLHGEQVGRAFDVAILEDGIDLLVAERDDCREGLVQLVVAHGALIVRVNCCINHRLLFMSQIRNSS